MASLKEGLERVVKENGKISDLTDEELKDVTGGMFVDHAFGVVYFSQSEWNNLSPSQQQMYQVFFDGDVRLVVLSDE